MRNPIKVPTLDFKYDIDLVLPCYNPPADFVKTITEYFWCLKDKFPDREINLFVVNDGSVRNFTEIQINQLKFLQKSVKIISYPLNRGKGYALRKAIAMTSSNLIIYTDYDFPFRLSTMEMLIDELDKGADVVMVGRNQDYLKKLTPLRRFYSKMSKRLNRVLLGLKYPETQGGLKGFNSLGKEVFLKTTIDEFLFDTEFIYRASREKEVSIICIPGITRNDIKPNKVPLRVIKRELMNFFRILMLKTH